ncbi:unnamed protein product [Musa banksii]
MARISVLFFFLSLLLLATAGVSAGAPRNRVGIYELRRGEFSVKVTNWGATITSVVLPDSKGKLADIALGYDGIRPYTNDTTNFGALVGRVANRIANARFTLNGTTYHLLPNDGNNTLHGGPRGFGRVIWTVKDKVDGEYPYITLYYRSFDGEQGFPGDLDVYVTYKIDDDFVLSVIMHAVPLTKPTPINLAQHTYWNLGGHESGSILEDRIKIFASHITPVNDQLIPTGEIRSVSGTPFDFRDPAKIGSKIGRVPGGYDINYVLSSPADVQGVRKVAVVEDGRGSGRVLELWANQPGVQFYTGNFLKHERGKNGHYYKIHDGLCLETQGFPDSVNHPNFPSQIYSPGQGRFPEMAEDGSPQTFKTLGVREELVEACESLGWKAPTKIQIESIPYALEGKDIIGLAQTGSGKTGAFAIPIIQALLETPQPFFACVLSPTRELAIQIAEQFEALGSGIGIKCTVLVGGVDMTQQAISLGKRPHIVVATPGRLLDHLTNTKGFSLRTIKYLVLDEADRLLNLEFEKAIDDILKVIPAERKTYLFSATMTKKVSKLQRACLRNPVKIEAASKYSTVDTLKQQFRLVPAKYKDCYLVYILTEMSGSMSMVFTRTCESTRLLSLVLRNIGMNAIPISGQMSQAKRLGALNRFKSGNCNILICTDVASRGLDIPSVDVVINYDIPTNSKDYVHRVGRTARAGRSGLALSLVNQYEVEWYLQIEQLIGKKLPEYPANETEVLIYLERVSDAKRIALMKIKDSNGNKRRKKVEEDGDEAEEYAGISKKLKASKRSKRW